jgi:CubicO group peptidase (beta-lactamase class C family)
MTATLAAIFVEQGSLRWESTIGEVFPELVDTMDAGLRGVTLEQLLSHTSGITDNEPTYLNLLVQSYVQPGPGNLDELRYWFLQQWITQPLQSPPGSQYTYSNAGYLIAGAMLERAGEAMWWWHACSSPLA